jgi:hypothetical protein
MDAPRAPWTNRVCDFCKTDTHRDDFSKQRKEGLQSKCRICCGDFSLSKVRRPFQTPLQIEARREQDARDRLAWEAEAETSRQKQRARTLEYERYVLERAQRWEEERVELERRREERRVLAKALALPMLRANALMMAASSFWSSTSMITHALAFLPAADFPACSVRTSKHLADTLKGTASVAAMWVGLLKRDFPAREVKTLASAQVIWLYQICYESRHSCNRCNGVFVDARLTRCDFCNEHVCDACERCACKCEKCCAPCLDDGTQCPGCNEQVCGDCADRDYMTCDNCDGKYCEQCTKTGITSWKVCQNPTVRTLLSP